MPASTASGLRAAREATSPRAGAASSEAGKQVRSQSSVSPSFALLAVQSSKDSLRALMPGHIIDAASIDESAELMRLVCTHISSWGSSGGSAAGACLISAGLMPTPTMHLQIWDGKRRTVPAPVYVHNTHLCTWCMQVMARTVAAWQAAPPSRARGPVSPQPEAKVTQDQLLPRAQLSSCPSCVASGAVSLTACASVIAQPAHGYAHPQLIILRSDMGMHKCVCTCTCTVCTCTCTCTCV